jgi:phospholipid/cholesterol/gamma-HCH transport system substrate-binding protein
MTVRGLISAAVTAVLAVVIIGLLAAGGGSSYRVRLLLTNADGLRLGSLVDIGGVPVGSVTSLGIDGSDRVVATLSLEQGSAPIGANATVAIRAKNLLGDNFVALGRGNLRQPQPSGVAIPASRISSPVDLDQVVSVLDPTTRAALTVLINEAGQSFLGRRADFSALLAQLPPSLGDATNLLGELVTDNHTLGQLIDRSSGFVSVLTPQRRALSNLINETGQAASTFAQRSGDLSASLVDAPGTLASLRAFLARLQQTTVPLKPAADTIAATAPELTTVLRQVTPFQQTANPTLLEAQRVAPELVRLGLGATPVLQHTAPVTRSLAAFTGSTPQLLNTLGQNVDQLMAILQGWSRAIQVRDGLSHFFRAKVNFTVDTLRNAVSLLTQLLPSQAAHQKRAVPGPVLGHPTAPSQPAPASAPSSGATRSKPPHLQLPPTLPSLPPVGVSGLTHTVGNVLGGLLKYLVGK